MTRHLNTYLTMPIAQMARHHNFNIDVVHLADDIDLSMHPGELKTLAEQILTELKFQPYFHLYDFTVTRNAFIIRAKVKNPDKPDTLSDAIPA